MMTDTAVAITDKPPIVILRERLEARKGELKAALTDITPEQFIRAVITSATINPEIQACTWQSVWIACMQACRDGLLPDSVEGAIVPFKSKATWIPMYQGLLRRFRRSGKFKWVTANVVREGEEFSHYVDEQGEHFRHVPGDKFDAPIAKVYAMATTQDGGVFVTVLSIAEANKIRNMSRATRDDAPWKLWESEMYKKTALRRLSKVLPSGRDIIPDEEFSEIEAPATSPQSPIARAPGAAAALTAFAASSAADEPPQAPPVEEGGGAQGTINSDAAMAQSAAAPSDDRNPAAAVPRVELGDDTVRVAYERGKRWRAAKNSKQLPGEYRDSNRTQEALAWEAGWAGQAMPSWREE